MTILLAERKKSHLLAFSNLAIQWFGAQEHCSSVVILGHLLHLMLHLLNAED